MLFLTSIKFYYFFKIYYTKKKNSILLLLLARSDDMEFESINFQIVEPLLSDKLRQEDYDVHNVQHKKPLLEDCSC